MAGGQERILKRRIQSVRATMKITHAMELIAASQIHRAQGRIRAARPYIDNMTEMMLDVARDAGGSAGKLLDSGQEIRRAGVLVVVADRGLCGAYNYSVLRAAERLLAAGEARGREHRVITVGRKAQGYFQFRHRRLDHSFVAMTDRPTYADASRVAPLLLNPFIAGDLDGIYAVSTRYKSAAIQQVEVRRVLPLPVVQVAEGLEVVLGTVLSQSGKSPASGTARAATALAGGAGTVVSQEGIVSDLSASGHSGGLQGYTEFEPESAALLAALLPRYAEAVVFGTLLEASASEHTARQRAMAAATENAEEFVKSLSRVMNRARQDAITTEIMEIAGGAEALRQAGVGARED